MTVSCLASCGSSCFLCSQKHWSQLWSEEKTSQCRSWLPRAGSCPIWRLAVLCRANVLIQRFQNAESIQSTSKYEQMQTSDKGESAKAHSGTRAVLQGAWTISKNAIAQQHPWNSAQKRLCDRMAGKGSQPHAQCSDNMMHIGIQVRHPIRYT